MAVDTTAAVGPSRLLKATLPLPLSTSASLSAEVCFISPVIDAFAAPGTLTTVVPVIAPGYRFLLNFAKGLVVTRTGTITGLPAGKMGSNGSHDNLVPSSTPVPNAAQISLADAGDVFNTIVSALTGKTALFGAPDTTAAIVFEQVTAATGTATLTYRLQLFGSLSAM